MSEWSEEGGVISWPVQMQWEVMCKLFTVVWNAAEGGIKWMACAVPGIPTNCCSPDLLCIRWLRKYRWYYFLHANTLEGGSEGDWSTKAS